MMQGALHPTPRERDVVREQIRIVGLSFRREALVIAVLLGIATVRIVVDIIRGTAETWFDSDGWAPIAILSFFFPFAVWRKEKPFGPAFLWTLPMDRRRLALAKVLAGWVWLMAGLLFFLLLELALAGLSGIAGAETISFFALTPATATYLLGSALVLGLRHALRWLVAAAGVTFLVASLREAFDGPHGIDALVDASGFFPAVQNAANVWLQLPHPAQLALSTFLSVGAGLAALWAAVSRHRERRRH